MDQLTPSDSISSRSFIESLIFLFDPSPLGTLSKISFVSSFILDSASFLSRLVLITLTPQFMSYPTPPGLTTPFSSMSVAATPPIGNP
jgi:hypothetical protein